MHCEHGATSFMDYHDTTRLNVAWLFRGQDKRIARKQTVGGQNMKVPLTGHG
jgi:hypothetical protein